MAYGGDFGGSFSGFWSEPDWMDMDCVQKIAKTTCLRSLALVASLLLLSGCQGSGGNGAVLSSASSSNGERPVQLVNAQTSQTSGQPEGSLSEPPLSVRLEFNETELAKAVERYRLNKKQKKSSYRSVGADLDGDGKAEILVLLEGQDWCAKTGCTLAIFTSGRTGYRPVATIRRVWGPVIVANERRNGWSDLVVNTGLPSRDQRVRLRFGASGYPGNAVTLTPMPKDIEVSGEVVIERVEIMPQEMVSNLQASQ